MVKRVGKKINGRYALISVFVARARIRLVVRRPHLLPFSSHFLDHVMYSFRPVPSSATPPCVTTSSRR